MALIRRPHANTGVPTVNKGVVLPAPKKKAFPPAMLSHTGETPILIKEEKELPKTIARPRRPIPRRASTVVILENHADGILEKINRRQRQIIVHSVLYYNMNTNIVSDSVFNRWSRELVKLQEDYPELTSKSAFYEDMKTFDGSTGFQFADHPWGVTKAPYILRIHKELGGGNDNE